MMLERHACRRTSGARGRGALTGMTAFLLAGFSIFDPTARLIGIIDLEVTPDVANLQQKIRSSTSSSGIRVSSSQGQIILSGVAVDAVAADRAMAVARSLAGEKGEVVNAMEVAPTQQV